MMRELVLVLDQAQGLDKRGGERHEKGAAQTRRQSGAPAGEVGDRG